MRTSTFNFHFRSDRKSKSILSLNVVRILLRLDQKNQSGSLRKSLDCSFGDMLSGECFAVLTLSERQNYLRIDGILKMNLFMSGRSDRFFTVAVRSVTGKSYKTNVLKQGQPRQRQAISIKDIGAWKQQDAASSKVWLRTKGEES